MSGREFSEGLDMMAGRPSFTVTGGKATGVKTPSGKRSFTDCTVESVPQPKGRKPHMAVMDRRGDVIFEVGARQSGAYQTLAEFAGQQIKRFSWEEFGSLYDDGTYLRCKIQSGQLRNVPDGYTPIPRIVLDTETTGLDPRYDEILQLSIIDGDGNTLLDRKYKPSRTDSWREAERINHISPASVAGCPDISTDLDEIQLILDRATEVCVYNAEFDLAFLGELGLRMNLAKVTDTMREYGKRYHGTHYWKLEKAAHECGYRYHAHDSLSDCRATLAVQQRLDGDSRRQETKRKVEAKTPIATVGHGGTPKNAPVTRASYLFFSALCWVFTAITAFAVLICFFGPALLLFAIPMALFDVWCFKVRRRMKLALHDGANGPVTQSDAAASCQASASTDMEADTPRD